MIEIPLVKGRGVALIDDADYELVSQYTWYVKLNRNVLYARRLWWEDDGRRQREQYMHVMLTGNPLTDHHDRDGLNNQRYNLRPATGAQNQANSRKPPGCTSVYKGVYWHRHAGKWAAQIVVSRRRRYLGLFADETDAARAYDTAALTAWGAFALLNFPEEQNG